VSCDRAAAPVGLAVADPAAGPIGAVQLSAGFTVFVVLAAAVQSVSADQNSGVECWLDSVAVHRRDVVQVAVAAPLASAGPAPGVAGRRRGAVQVAAVAPPASAGPETGVAVHRPDVAVAVAAAFAVAGLEPVAVAPASADPALVSAVVQRRGAVPAPGAVGYHSAAIRVAAFVTEQVSIAAECLCPFDAVPGLYGPARWLSRSFPGAIRLRGRAVSKSD
jgi:hypothetical protein